MFELLSIIDSKEYTLNEIYQGQLYEKLLQTPEIRVTFQTLDEILGKRGTHNPKNFDGVYCSLKVRNTIKFAEQIGLFLNECPVIVQDYDPWCNFIDSSPWKNGYAKIQNNLNVKSFFVSAKFWSDMLQASGFNSTPIKLGMLPKFVSSGKKFSDRNSLVQFRGSAHPDRLKGHDELHKHGLLVEWMPKVTPYSKFLDELTDLKVWAHNEQEPVVVNGRNVCANSLWPKGLEVLARGCYVIRDYQPESSWYDFKSLPTAFLFDTPSDAPKFLDVILGMPETEQNQRIQETVAYIASKDYYGDIIKQIIECSND